MAVWGGLGQAATVAQLVGADVGGLISMIMQAAVTARQNRKECEQLARRVFMIAELLPHLQDPEVMRRPLAGLEDTLREAHELVTSCQGRSAAYRLIMAGWQASKFRDVQSKIDSYLIVFPIISHIGVTRRLDRIYDILIPRDANAPEIAEEVAHEVVLLHGDKGEEFTFAELMAATKNFHHDMVIGEGSFGKVFMGWLSDGREVAIKRSSEGSLQGVDAFMAEVTILSPIRHDHIIRLLGWCTVEKEYLLVYEYMKNGSLENHMFDRSSSSSYPSSPVRASWKMRIEILLGVSRAIEYLQSSDKQRPVIHRDIKMSNILLDSSWAPRLTDFGLSLALEPGADGCEVPVIGTYGYAAPEYVATGHLKPTSDVYSLGVVMLEVLTGRRAMFDCEEDNKRGRENLVYFALPFIESGKLQEVLDRRLTAKLTLRQLKAVKLVAQTAAGCVRLQERDRPAMSDVVANLEAALVLVRRSG